MISARSHYACLAVVELARQSGSDRPVALREITDRHAVPQPFLVQILQQLKAAGLVRSTRGSQGGYQLNRRPQDLMLSDVVDAIEGDAVVAPPTVDRSPEAAELGRVWRAAADAHRSVLASTSISDVLTASQSGASAQMFYI